MQTLTTEPDLLTDAARRLLRVIVSEHEHRAFTGNAHCHALLIKGGYIEIVHRQGPWYRLRPTPRGFAWGL
jgi:hypothetical protein